MTKVPFLTLSKKVFLTLFVYLIALIYQKNGYSGNYAMVVFHMPSGRTLHGVNHHQPIYPASLTKMMTLYLVFDALKKGRLKLHHRMRVSRRAAAQVPCKVGLKIGDYITVKNAILAVICRSANDASVVLAEHLAGSERRFARLMTQRAKGLGLRRTNFVNATGLFHPRQRSTAYELGRIGMKLIQHHPKEYAFFRSSHFHFRGEKYRSHNKVLHLTNGVDGIKTGYIKKSGFNLVSSAKRRGRRILAVVIGGPTARWRDRHMVEILDTAFEKPHHLPLITAHLQSGWDGIEYLSRLAVRPAQFLSSAPPRLLNSKPRTIEELMH
jgi:D-alanyl-D-alanine carboxypeptidase